jgi:hypothetical protein
MNPSFEQTLVEVWRQVLIDNANVVKLLSGSHYSTEELATGGFHV